MVQCMVLLPHDAYDPHVSVSFIPRAHPLPSTSASAWSSLHPLTDQCLGYGSKNPATATEGNTSPRRYPRLVAIQHAKIPPLTTPARRTTPPNRSSHAPRMPRPYPPRPKCNPRLAAMEWITTQSPRRHPAQNHHRPASHCKCRTTLPSHSSHSTRQPRLDLAMLKYFPFYAPAPPRSCDDRV
jgi:hypothetical protein